MPEMGSPPERLLPSLEEEVQGMVYRNVVDLASSGEGRKRHSTWTSEIPAA